MSQPARPRGRGEDHPHGCKRHSDVPNCGFVVAFAVTVLRKRLRSPVLAPHAAHEKRAGLFRPFPLVLALEATRYTRNFRRRVPTPTRVPPSSMSVIPPSGTGVSKPCITFESFPFGESQAKSPT